MTCTFCLSVAVGPLSLQRSFAVSGKSPTKFKLVAEQVPRADLPAGLSTQVALSGQSEPYIDSLRNPLSFIPPLPSLCLSRDFAFPVPPSLVLPWSLGAADTYTTARPVRTTTGNCEPLRGLSLKLYEDAIRSKSKKPKGDAKSIDPDDSDDDSRAEEASPTRAATAPVTSEDRPDMDAAAAPAAGSGSPTRPRPTTPKFDDSGSVKSVTATLPMDESTPYAVKARTEMVHRELEGLRDEAFELARDIGIESLTAPGGLRSFITQLRNVVFPRAAEEARELFRAGQRHVVLARQGGESMLPYVSRRRRWWKLLKSLDSSIELSEPMRVELLLELSGLSRQESLVIKACTSDSRSFEAVAATLVEHYSGVHLKEGRSLGGGTFQDRRHNNHGARTEA